MASIRHPLFARFYSRLVVPMMRRSGADAHRERLVSGLSGTVVEVGCGPGDNFALYPSEVTSVVAVEPEPFLRARAGEAAAAATGEPGRVGVVEGTADALPVADGSADAVVFSLVLCSVHDVPAALAEARRVLRPGGEIRVLEHVAAPDSPRMRRVFLLARLQGLPYEAIADRLKLTVNVVQKDMVHAWQRLYHTLDVDTP